MAHTANGSEARSVADAASAAGSPTVRRTRRWRGVVAVALAALAVGVLAKRPSLLLLAAVGVAFAAYPHVTRPPSPDLVLRREVSPESPDHGEVVRVQTTLRNEGDAALFDCRLVDGVPPMLSVTDESPRQATALAPGEETTVSYFVEARRGRHRFRPATVLGRDASGATEVETTVDVDEETTVDCGSRVPGVPLRSRSRHRAGRLVTERGGSGVEFHRVEEYERGDPASRIDWRRFARTGELSAIQFRAERLAEVVVCVDARAEAYRASGPNEPHAVAYAVDAAESLAESLFEDGQRVGLAAFGRTRCWVPPGSGRNHEDRLRRRLATDPVFSPLPPESARPADAEQSAWWSGDGAPTEAVAAQLLGGDGPEADGEQERDPLERQLAFLRSRLDSNAQVLLLTPLCDDGATSLAQRLESAGPAVTVVSPDVTTDGSVGGRLARVERDGRLAALRNAGIPAVDWQPDRRLGAELADLERWER